MVPINSASEEKSNGGGGSEQRSGSLGAILEDVDDGPPKKAPARKTRYGRSATTSVTQLLSTSCNTLLQKFRRNPSEKPEKKSRASSSQQR